MCNHATDLKTAEDELGPLRQRLAIVATWIHNPIYDHTARQALAQALGLPEPTPEKTHG